MKNNNFLESFLYLITQNPTLFLGTMIIFIVLTVVLLIMFISERFSKKAKDIAETSKLMAEALKSNTESISSVPEIVNSFNGLVTKTIELEMKAFDQKIEKKIDAILTQKEKNLDNATNDAKNKIIEIEKLFREFGESHAEIDSMRSEIESTLVKAKEIIPDYKVWKGIVNPSPLLFAARKGKSWDDIAGVIAQARSIIETIDLKSAVITSGQVESFGDICKDYKEISLAMWFYEKACNLDKENISSLFELECLRIVYVVEDRDKSINLLSEKVLNSYVGMTDTQYIAFFNALINSRRYQDLYDILQKVLLNRPLLSKSIRALVHRNIAIALRRIQGVKTPEFVAELFEGLKEYADEQNILKDLVDYYLENGEIEKAEEFCKKLIILDIGDSDYYERLIKIYSKQNKIEEIERVKTYILGLQLTEEKRYSFDRVYMECKKYIISNDPQFFEKNGF